MVSVYARAKELRGGVRRAVQAGACRGCEVHRMVPHMVHWRMVPHMVHWRMVLRGAVHWRTGRCVSHACGEMRGTKLAQSKGRTRHGSCRSRCASSSGCHVSEPRTSSRRRHLRGVQGCKQSRGVVKGLARDVKGEGCEGARGG